MSQSKVPINLALIAKQVRELFPLAFGAYLFGSAAAGELRDESDIDIAILQEGELDPLLVLQVKSFLSKTFGRDADVVDLLRADSVTAAQIVATGQAFHAADSRKLADFETMAFSRYALLNEERSEIIKDIQDMGSVYGR